MDRRHLVSCRQLINGDLAGLILALWTVLDKLAPIKLFRLKFNFSGRVRFREYNIQHQLVTAAAAQVGNLNSSLHRTLSCMDWAEGCMRER
jgi:hypothetical protein